MEKIWMLTIDGTSDGSYENCANSLLFKTYEDAKEFVERDFIDDVVNDFGLEDKKEIADKVSETCEWYGPKSAQFRHGDTITDYKIEIVSIPA